MSTKRNSTAQHKPSHDWMTPVDPSAPCGVDLEYDPEFVVLSAQVAAKMDAQYGDFVGSPEPINWSDVERDCRRLMMRSKDIRLAVLFTRCRTRLGAAPGLAEGLGLLASWLTVFADTVHPQPGVDDDKDAALEIRMNALQALTDTDGLLSDVRDIALARSSATRLQVRDVERAFAQPRPSDALSVESVTRQLEDVRVQQPALMAGFDAALESLDVIDTWNRERLGEFAADLAALTRMLERVVGEGSDAAHAVSLLEGEIASPEFDGVPATAALDAATPESPQQEAQSGVAGRTLSGRDAALQSIRDARHWFERHEPSSPIPILLFRAEQFVGKRYVEAVKAIPAELIAEWAKDE
ncbi:ImpA family type VI secretion system protein [Paraburkholderia aromaticivorans]|uniref:Type VI secretion protein ImpA n=1 Tax=Paraburkholderia aromaticivorans TaxID=2026199 RepID=A0A248VFH4_9BURK|nr:type VI secretion system ImpA family N-terminal domain-containing protein [Paraburkholderia aromaticivorans]ASV97594.1 type VI secretion protein ImpA [Paraburkholderia aromaticivorans]